MNLKRAIVSAILICVVVELVQIISSRAFSADLKVTDPSNIPAAMLITVLIALVVAVIAGTWWYLQSPGVVSSLKSGLYFGLLLAVLGFVGDVFAFVPYTGGLDLFQKYFTHFWFWSAFILIIVVCGLTGFIKAGIQKYDH